MQKFYRLNQYIYASTLRVLDEQGKQIGLFKKDEAIRKANELGLDLVEIAPNAKPPVAKIIDFKKFKYLESKREQELKKKSKEVEIKEIRLRPFIGEHDFDVRVNQATGFLKDGHRLRIAIQFQGREFAKKEFGFKILDKLNQRLNSIAVAQAAPKFEGRTLVSFYIPVKSTSYDKSKNNQDSQ
ncbi:MAG: translation initiation factor IF-3 [Candidatus Gottesmanbacteria bacterium]